MQYWIYSPGYNAKFWDECVDENIMILGWDRLGNYSNDSEEVLTQKLSVDGRVPRNSIKALIDFRDNLKVGDIVIAKKGVYTLLGYGKVTSDYYFDESRVYYKSTRKIEWIKVGQWDIRGKIASKQLVQKTLTNLTQYGDFAINLINIMDNEEGMKEMNNKELFKKYYFDNIEKVTNEAKHALDLVNEFQTEYPLQRIRELSVDEYVLGKPGKEPTLSYKLEYGKYKEIVSVGAGVSRKHGAFWRKQNNSLEIAGKIIPSEEIDEKWTQFRNELYLYLSQYKNATEPLKRKSLEQYSLLDNMDTILTKLLCQYYPDKFVPIVSKTKIIALLDFFDYDYESLTTSEDLNFVLAKQLKKDFDFLENKNLLVAGWILWRFLHNVILGENQEEQEYEEKIQDYDVDEYTKEDFLNEVFIESEKYESIVSALKLKKNIILEGAPGVGKTFMAKRLAYSLMGCTDRNRVELLQFHQSYSYEDFVEGIRPNDSGKFIIQKGIFYNLCKRAEEDSENDYYLIIDEINRGNLSKIFGELLMLIEADKREEKLRLAYSQELFSIPSNLYIIGCMNTADRSLALIDYALRRRFSFIRVEPAFDNRKFREELSRNFGYKAAKILSALKEINSYIAGDKSLGKGFMVGHSYFCNRNKEDLNSIITYDILPLFEEYWYDDEESLEKCKTVINGVLND